MYHSPSSTDWRMRNHWVVFDVETSISEEAAKVSGPGGRANPYGGAKCVYMGWLMSDGPASPGVSCGDFEYVLTELSTTHDKPQYPVVYVGHNVSFDLHHVFKDKDLCAIAWDFTIWDTMTAEYYLEAQSPESRSVSLDDLFDKYGWDAPKDTEIKELFRQGIGADLIDPSKLIPYLHNDVAGTLRVAIGQMRRAHQAGMLPFLREMMDAQLAFTAMEQVGLYVNQQAVDEFETAREGDFQRCKDELTALVERRLPDLDPVLTVLGDNQLKTAICGGTYRAKRKKQDGFFKNGKPRMRTVTEQEFVQPMAGFPSTCPVPENFDVAARTTMLGHGLGPEPARYLEMVQLYHDLQKDIKTYVEGYLRRVDGDSIMRTNYNQCITPSGRVSSSNPNLQNLTK